jgi:hypothetical protein
MECPKCGKTVLLITRNWGTKRRWTTVEIHHHEDARRYEVGAPPRICVVRMSFVQSQKLIDKLA